MLLIVSAIPLGFLKDKFLYIGGADDDARESHRLDSYYKLLTTHRVNINTIDDQSHDFYFLFIVQKEGGHSSR